MDILRNEKEKFLSFEASQRLDEFFFSIVSLQSDSKEFDLFLHRFWHLVTVKLALREGLALKTVLLTNMKPSS